MQFDGTVGVVTGAGGGIGRELVRGLVRRGARVAAVDLREDALADTVAAVSADGGTSTDVATFVVDITDRAAVKALPEQVTEALGPVDLLVNNAGIIQPFVRLRDLDEAAVDRVLDVNLRGTISMVQAFLPGLLERPVAHVANVSSMGGFLPVPGQAVYGAAKAGVKLLTEGLYAELLDTRVGVTAIMPGAIGTDITANSGVEIPGSGDREQEEGGMRTTSPEEAAEIILSGIADDRLHVYVGMDARMLNLAVRIAPKQAANFITARMAGLLDADD